MKYKHIIFDFDGVLIESNKIRSEGFQLLFEDYPKEQVERLLCFVKRNGGLSRYDKIRYFFEQVRNEIISESSVRSLAGRYSELVKDRIIHVDPVKGALNFLSKYQRIYDFAIVSGSDQEELREVSKFRKIKHFFSEILGSPASKESNVSELITKGWKAESCIFVGDSVNDLKAARSYGIDFIGRNSDFSDWHLEKNIIVISDLTELHLHLI